jgi:hypothetical protein
MLTELSEGIFWDNEKLLWQQTSDAQQLINEALLTPVLSRTYEVCIDNKRRTTTRTYRLTDVLVLLVQIIYNSPAMSKDFMGVNDFKYIIEHGT